MTFINENSNTDKNSIDYIIFLFDICILNIEQDISESLSLYCKRKKKNKKKKSEKPAVWG